MALFAPKVDHTGQIAAHLKRLVELYELDLQSRGITTVGLDGMGEIYLTSPDQIAEKEEKDAIRAALGLPDHYDVGGALPTGPGGFGSSAQEARQTEETNLFAAAAPSSFPPGFLQDAYSTPWGVGPEGAEKPTEHPHG